MCFPVIVCHAVYVMLNLKVNLKAYFSIMKGETMETRLTGDVTDSDNVSPAHYCFFQFSRAKRLEIGKLSNLRFSEENVSKESANLLFLFVELHSAMYTLSLFVHGLRLALQMFCFLQLLQRFPKLPRGLKCGMLKLLIYV